MPATLIKDTWFPIRGFDDTSPPHDVSMDMASNILNIQRTEKGVEKRDGYDKVNETILTATATVLHQDTLNLSNGTSFEIFNTSDGKIRTQADVSASILEGFATGQPVYTEQLLDTMIFAQGATAMRTYDGTSSGTITASPHGKYITEHLEQLWTAGIDGQLSLISASAVGDIHTWSGAGTADINVAQNDGTKVTGLAEFKNDLIIFKEKSIYKLIGFDAASFQVVNVAKNIGCVEHRTIRNVGSGLVFAFEDGVYFYDGSQVAKVSGFQQMIWNTFNKTRYGFWDSVVQTDRKEYILTVPVGSATENTIQLVYYYDQLWKDEQNRIHMPSYEWSGINMASVHVSKIGSTNVDILYVGDYTGFIKKRTASKSDDGALMTTYIDSPQRSARSISSTKNQRRMYVPVENNVGDLDVYYSINDDDTSWILAESMSGQGGSTGDGIGETFQIGVSQIGVAGSNSTVQRVNFNGAQGRRIKTRLRQDSAIRTWEINGPIEIYDKFRGHKHG